MSNCDPYLFDETESETTWKPTRMDTELFDLTEDRDQTETLFLYRSLTSILNKLTLENISTLITKLENLPVNTPIKMQNVVNMIHEKAINEVQFRPVYAKVCNKLKKKRMADETGTSSISFASILANRCTRHFDISLNEVVLFDKRKFDISLLNCEETRKAELDECIENETRHFKQCVGNCCFIAELFKFNIIPRGILFHILERLSKSRRSIAMESICAILITIGEFYERKFGKLPSAYFGRIESTVFQTPNELPMRIRFMAQDLFDLKQNSWQPRNRRLEMIDEPFTLQIKGEALEECASRNSEEVDQKPLIPLNDESTAATEPNLLQEQIVFAERIAKEKRDQSNKEKPQNISSSNVLRPLLRPNNRLDIKNQTRRSIFRRHSSNSSRNPSTSSFIRKPLAPPTYRRMLDYINGNTVNNRGYYPNSNDWTDNTRRLDPRFNRTKSRVRIHSTDKR
ncbi:eukaryotic translation initiation factor 4 gamma 3-like [Planococcus citri]|uniref:eukaryotic translation initiation factor 4 gamma 3-like n=1 Tax=Planococcus citri TaxID=170843 RepID=UPI0031F8E285